MKPKPPPRVAFDVTKIKQATWNNLIGCVEYAMEHPRGDGATILTQANGTLGLRRRSGTGAGGAPASGLVIGVIKSATVGGGPATIAEITLNADGSYTESTAVHNVIIPRY